VSSGGAQRDVIFLVADRNMEAAVLGLLGRPESLAIRRVGFVIRTHPQRDPGCYRRAHEFLGPFRNRYAYAIVLFDREGCGNQTQPRETLEAEVEERLAGSGWRDRAGAIAVDPELESWVWSDSPQVDTALGWAGHTPALRSWLIERGLLERHQAKPGRPKEAMEAALRVVRKPRSSAIYQELAATVSLRRCADPAFLKLRNTLQGWFPAE
jgi:hypothetical protein